MAKMKLGIIGAGVIGKTHIKTALDSTDFELVGVADPDPAAWVLPRQFGIRCYENHQELLAADKPDAVIVATPNKLHVPIGIECARAGIQVFVEKPIAESVEAANELNAEAKKAGVVVQVGHHRRHYTRMKEARHLVRSGAIGELVGVAGMWASLKPDSYYQVAWRIQPGGGPVMINLIHEIDSLRFICGEITEVRAQKSNRMRGYAVEDTAAVILTLANGALGTVFASDAAATPWNLEMGIGENPNMPMTGQNAWYFMGSQGSLSFPNLTLWTYRDPARRGWDSPLAPQPVPHFEHNAYPEQLRHFHDVIRGKAEPLISGEDGTRTLAVILAILESAKTGEAVRIAE
ncbi:MAG: Gfo/Idh/MocA family oxidoreductase [Deltaproteobacteria bacterium]|nr:Gfo/Idh/MocA family oxidoreductase [Deltaproteobacteria bacterium]